MDAYALHEIRQAELVREADEARLVAEVRKARKARREASGHEPERRVTSRLRRATHTRPA